MFSENKINPLILPKLFFKEIKKNAVNAIFKDEIEGMDEHSKNVLKKVIGYMKKKYISGPMKLAKEIILKNAN